MNLKIKINSNVKPYQIKEKQMLKITKIVAADTFVEELPPPSSTTSENNTWCYLG